MISRAVKRRLAQDVALWQVDGLVGEDAARVLRERYDVEGFGLAAAARYLGIMGALLAGFGVLGAVAVLSGSIALGALLLLAVAAGLLAWGLRMAGDPRGRAVQSSRAVLALGLFCLSGAGVAAAQGADAGQGATLLVTGLVTVPVAFVLAYRFRNGFLLVLGLLALFHWIGSWHAMVGQGSYAFDIQDPRVMALAAAAAAVVGILQRRGKLPGPARFDAAFLSVGLLYLNLSLLILTVDGYPTLPWVWVALAAALLQLVLGAVEKSAVLTGFGVTALAVNLFTRYFERCWDAMGKGAFFLLGGAGLFLFGLGCERLARRRPLGAAPLTAPCAAPAPAGPAAPGFAGDEGDRS
jgi:hypothetical protein